MEELIAELQEIDKIIPLIIIELSEEMKPYASDLLELFNNFQTQVDHLNKTFTDKHIQFGSRFFHKT